MITRGVINVINVGEIDIDSFSEWIKQSGGEILPLTNQYEVIRFKGKEVGVLYTTGKYSGRYALKTFQQFKEKKSWLGRPNKTKRKSKSFKDKIVPRLLKRDGNLCYLCRNKMSKSDMTLEHLIPLTAGGSNTPSNIVLVHEKCNQILGYSTVVEKIDLIIAYRVAKAIENKEENNKPF